MKRMRKCEGKWALKKEDNFVVEAAEYVRTLI